MEYAAEMDNGGFHVRLTQREQEILSFLADDLTNDEIAEHLVVAPSTVKWYVKQLYSKLDIHSRSEVVSYAAQISSKADVDEAAKVPNNLPISATSLIGRAREISDVCAYLTDEETRLLTLVGPPGIGKTRLCLECAATLLTDFSDGVFYVELAALRDSRQVPEVLLQTLDLRDSQATDPVDQLKRHLRDRCVLLVLDNFEHILSASRLVADLLASAPRLRVLATSRESLRISGEQEYLVPPLNLPDEIEALSLDELSKFDAIALFIKRAKAIKPDFDVTPANALAISELCRALDSLPLTIELAATRIKLFSPEALLARLDRRLSALGAGARDRPQRHQSLRAALDWSYHLLTDEEAKLLQRLSVFAGGWHLDSVEPVCGYDLASDPFDVLESLLSKSLVQQIGGTAGEPRFLLLGTIREYAAEKLQESGSSETLHQIHCQYFLALAEGVDDEFYGTNHAVRMHRLENEYGNFREAFLWSLERDLDTCGRLVAALAETWRLRFSTSEQLSWVEPLLEQADDLSPLVGAGIFWVAANIFLDIGADAQTYQYLTTAITLARESGDARLPDYLRLAAFVADQLRDHDTARQLVDESFRLFEAAGDQQGFARSLNTSANIYLSLRDLENAQSQFEQALAVWRELNLPIQAAGILNNLGLLFWLKDDFTSGERCFNEAIAIYNTKNVRGDCMRPLINLSRMLVEQGEWQRAIPYFEQSIAIGRSYGRISSTALALASLAICEAHLGRVRPALELQAEALQAIQTDETVNNSLGVFKALVDIAAVRERWAEAATIQGAWEAEAERQNTSAFEACSTVECQTIQRRVAVLREQLGEAQYAQCWSHGHSLTYNEAIDFWRAQRLADPGLQKSDLLSSESREKNAGVFMAERNIDGSHA